MNSAGGVVSPRSEMNNASGSPESCQSAAPVAQFKMKSKMMNKFLNEPLEALDLRLKKAEDSLGTYFNNPLEEFVKQEQLSSQQLLAEPSKAGYGNEETQRDSANSSSPLVTKVKQEFPLDCSEVQMIPADMPPSHQTAAAAAPHHRFESDPDFNQDEDRFARRESAIRFSSQMDPFAQQREQREKEEELAASRRYEKLAADSPEDPAAPFRNPLEVKRERIPSESGGPSNILAAGDLDGNVQLSSHLDLQDIIVRQRQLSPGASKFDLEKMLKSVSPSRVQRVILKPTENEPGKRGNIGSRRYSPYPSGSIASQWEEMLNNRGSIFDPISKYSRRLSPEHHYPFNRSAYEHRLGISQSNLPWTNYATNKHLEDAKERLEAGWKRPTTELHDGSGDVQPKSPYSNFSLPSIKVDPPHGRGNYWPSKYISGGIPAQQWCLNEDRPSNIIRSGSDHNPHHYDKEEEQDIKPIIDSETMKIKKIPEKACSSNLDDRIALAETSLAYQGNPLFASSSVLGEDLTPSPFPGADKSPRSPHKSPHHQDSGLSTSQFSQLSSSDQSHRRASGSGGSEQHNSCSGGEAKKNVATANDHFSVFKLNPMYKSKASPEYLFRPSSPNGKPSASLGNHFAGKDQLFDLHREKAIAAALRKPSPGGRQSHWPDYGEEPHQDKLEMVNRIDRSPRYSGGGDSQMEEARALPSETRNSSVIVRARGSQEERYNQAGMDWRRFRAAVAAGQPTGGNHQTADGTEGGGGSTSGTEHPPTLFPFSVRNDLTDEVEPKSNLKGEKDYNLQRDLLMKIQSRMELDKMVPGGSGYRPNIFDDSTRQPPTSMVKPFDIMNSFQMSAAARFAHDFRNSSLLTSHAATSGVTAAATPSVNHGQVSGNGSKQHHDHQSAAAAARFFSDPSLMPPHLQMDRGRAAAAARGNDNAFPHFPHGHPHAQNAHPASHIMGEKLSAKDHHHGQQLYPPYAGPGTSLKTKIKLSDSKKERSLAGSSHNIYSKDNHGVGRLHPGGEHGGAHPHMPISQSDRARATLYHHYQRSKLLGIPEAVSSSELYAGGHHGGNSRPHSNNSKSPNRSHSSHTKAGGAALNRSRDETEDMDEDEEDGEGASNSGVNSSQVEKSGKRGRPRKHAPKIPLPPLYVFIRNLLHNPAYNPNVVAWVDEGSGCFKVTSTTEFAKTWGKMKSNRSEEMNYEKMSRAMRYHYGSEKHGRKGHLAMVKEKRLFYRFGELAVNWRRDEMAGVLGQCKQHDICKGQLCLWTKE